MSYMTISSQENHHFSLCSYFHAHPTTLLLKILGGTNAWAVPHLPLKYVTPLRAPIFSSKATCIGLHTICLNSRRRFDRGFCPGILSGRFCPGILPGRFCPGWFLSVPLLSEYINYIIKLNITFNIRFHMYEIFFKVWRHMLLDPLPHVTNCHTFSNPSPSS